MVAAAVLVVAFGFVGLASVTGHLKPAPLVANGVAVAAGTSVPSGDEPGRPGHTVAMGVAN
jgi:hypothetical protein